ncbi:MAG: deoxyguanosinetriphosphate triphosphohydrolase, partial [Flavitalea sp.]
ARTYYKDIEDTNEALAFLRARVINHLVSASVEVFMHHQQEILDGNFNSTLIEKIQEKTDALKNIQTISVNKIYNHESVIQVEIAGYNVMSELLQLFVPALLKTKPSHKEEKVLRLIPYQFTEFEQTDSAYEKILNALDLLSGMTDEYATELYRNLKGIAIPRH